MNAAFLIMSSAALAGADPTPPPPPPAAPIVVSGSGCSNCGAPAVVDCCGSSRAGLFDRIKARFGGRGKKSHDCGCAPACPPAPVCNPCPPPPPCNTCCPTSIANRPNLLDSLKARWGKKKHGPCCDPCCDPCAGGAVIGGAPPVITTPGAGTGTTPPKEMPKPKDVKPKDVKPKGGNTSATPAPLPAVPTINGASGSSPY